MNILFITNVPARFPVLSGYVPLGIVYLSSVLKRAGHLVEVCTPRLTEARRTIKDFKPSIVAYSACTGGVSDYFTFNRKIKNEFDVFSVFGGPHPTYFPEMIEEEGVDAVCRGEGEAAMLEMADVLERGGDVTRLENWWVKKNKVIYKNDLRPLIQNLDTIPHPDRSLFFDNRLDKFT